MAIRRLTYACAVLPLKKAACNLKTEVLWEQARGTNGLLFWSGVRELLLFGRRFFSGGLWGWLGGFFGDWLFRCFFSGGLFEGWGWLASDLFGQFVERLAEVFFEFGEGFGEAVGAFADLFECGGAFGAESGFSFGEPLAQQLPRGVGLAGGFVKGLFKLINELAGFIEVNFHGV